MVNKGSVFRGKNEETIEGYRELNWYDSRGQYLGFDIINETGVSIQSFVAFDEV